MDSINIIEKENSKNLLVIFSARNTTKGKFTFGRKFKSLPATRVYLNDYNQEWYTQGVPDYPSDEKLVEFLNECKRKYVKGVNSGSWDRAWGLCRIKIWILSRCG